MALEEKDIVRIHKPDRRLLPNVPSKRKKRKAIDRRHLTTDFSDWDDVFKDFKSFETEEEGGQRFLVDYDVTVFSDKSFHMRKNFHAKAVNISCSGILLQIAPEDAAELEDKKTVHLKFDIKPGSLSEGLEMHVSQQADIVRLEQKC
jgi:hypothetical protein